MSLTALTREPVPPALLREPPSRLAYRSWVAYHKLTLRDTGDQAFNRQIGVTLAFEGGLNDSRTTTGELSNYGISLRSFPKLGEDGVINLTRDQAVEIYYSGTLPDGTSEPFGWLHVGFDKWPDFGGAGVAGKCFDLTINPGMGHGLAVVVEALKSFGVSATVAGWRDPTLVSALLTAAQKAGAGANGVLAQIRISLGDYYEAQVGAGNVPAAYLPGLLRRAAS